VLHKVPSLQPETIREVIGVLIKKGFTLGSCLGAGTSGLVIKAINELG